jgi:hypothetical protein
MSEENLLLDDVGYDTLDYMDYQWPIAEGFEMRGDEVIVVLSDEERECIKDYIVEQRTRQIPVNYLQKHLPEVFDKLIDVDEYEDCEDKCEDDCTSRFQYMHPYDMKDYDIIAKDDILEEAFDRMPMDEYIRYQSKNGTVVVSREGQIVSPVLPMPEDRVWSVNDLDLMALSLYRLQDGKWQMDKDLTWLEMTIMPESISTLVGYMYEHHSRMISLYDLREIAPEVFVSIADIEDADWTTDVFSEEELMQLYIALRGDIVEVVFDMIYDSQFC